eukprot:GDKH01026874.1.p1 GENE.GDKH01026874.1~~GDKH01026874.1.p1  ORF type:complete len:73 (-),score=3.24 GDKH01026874.1:108-326(-)
MHTTHRLRPHTIPLIAQRWALGQLHLTPSVATATEFRQQHSRRAPPAPSRVAPLRRPVLIRGGHAIPQMASL